MLVIFFSTYQAIMITATAVIDNMAVYLRQVA